MRSRDEPPEQVRGYVGPGFDGALDAFHNCFSSVGELGASVAAIVDGELVVDLHGGTRQDRPPTPWDTGTIVNTYSVNTERWRRAEIPAVNGHGTALSVARFYAGLGAGGTLDGVRLFSPDLVNEATAVPQLEAEDRVLGRPVSWGLGVQIGSDGFGMGGIGGNAAGGEPPAPVTRSRTSRADSGHMTARTRSTRRCGWR